MNLSPREITVLRSLTRTACTLLLIFRLDKPIGRNEIAEILDIAPATAARYLKSLTKKGLVTRTGYRNGYILTVGGRQLILGQERAELALEALSPVKTGTQDAEDGAQQVLSRKALSPVNPGTQALSLEALSPVNPGTKVVIDGALKDLPQSVLLVPEPETSKNESAIFALSETNESEISLSKVKKCHFQKCKSGSESEKMSLSKEEEEESINLINPSSSSSLSKNEKINFRNLPSISILLGATDLLFGKFVTGFGLPERPPEIVLGWLAHAYNERAGLRSPAGVAYRGIEKGALPRSQYLEYPEAYLPPEYLQAVGLGRLISPEELLEIETEPDADEDQTPDGIVEDPSIDQPVGKYTPRKAWQAVLDHLRYEIPKATFDTWVAHTWPVRYDHLHNVMIVGACSAYACEWLSDRLTSTVTRLLTGLFNQSVEVKFEEHQGDGKC